MGTQKLSLDAFKDKAISPEEQKNYVAGVACTCNFSDDGGASSPFGMTIFNYYANQYVNSWYNPPYSGSYESSYLTGGGGGGASYDSIYNVYSRYMLNSNPTDYVFDTWGNLVQTTNSNSNDIYVKTFDGNVLLSKLDLNNFMNLITVDKVLEYYARKLGVLTNDESLIGLSYHPNGNLSDRSLAFTYNDTEGKKHIAINISGGKINPLLDNVYNLMSTLQHEKIHYQKGIDPETPKFAFSHAEVYLQQMQDSVFKKTTADYQRGIIGSAANYIQEAADFMMKSAGSIDKVAYLVKAINKQIVFADYRIELQMTQNGYSNPDGYKFETKVVYLEK